MFQAAAKFSRCTALIPCARIKLQLAPQLTAVCCAASQLDRAAQVAADARAAWAEANSKHNERSTERAGLETKLGRDYGPDDVFLPLNGRCVSAHVEKYEYEVCPFGAAAQKDGGSSTRRAVLPSIGFGGKP